MAFRSREANFSPKRLFKRQLTKHTFGRTLIIDSVAYPLDQNPKTKQYWDDIANAAKTIK